LRSNLAVILRVTLPHKQLAGCSKWPDFLPTQPWRAKTRLVPSKAAGESKPEAYPLGYVEDFDEPRTQLADFFSILLADSIPPQVRDRKIPKIFPNRRPDLRQGLSKVWSRPCHEFDRQTWNCRG
jgi:hypothetical protein